MIGPSENRETVYHGPAHHSMEAGPQYPVVKERAPRLLSPPTGFLSSHYHRIKGRSQHTRMQWPHIPY
jgi:hypothetical protein